MIRLTFQSVLVLLVLAVLTNWLHPLRVSSTAEVACQCEADGSPIMCDGRAAGPDLMGPPFVNPRHIFGRLPATTPLPRNGVAAAQCRMPSAATVDGLSEEALRELIRAHSNPRGLGLFGEPRVNVADLDLALDALAR